MNYDNYYKNGGMTKEESVSAIALRIGAKKEAVAKFVEKNNIDTNKLNSDLKSGQVYFLDVITAIVGKPNNKYEKEIIKKYGNKMAMGGKTQGYDDREDERLGMDYGKISGKDFDGSHDMREHSRRDDARFEERMEKGGKLYYTMNNVGKSKYTIHFNDGEKTHKDGSPFYDIAIFSNRKDFERAEKKLQSEGYKYRYEDGGETERKAEAIKTAVEIATMAYKNGVRAYDMDFEDFSERIFYISKTSYPIVDLRLAYNALLNSGYKNGGMMADGGSVDGFSVGDRVIYKNGKYPFTIVELVDDENLPYANIKDYDGKIKKAYLNDLTKVKLMVAEEYVNTDLMNRLREGKMADGGEIKVINLSDDDKLNYFINKQDLVEKQDRESDDYTFINDMLTTTYDGKKFYSLGYDTPDKGRVFSLEEAKKNARIITDSQLGQKWDVIIKEVGGAFGEQDFTKKQYVVMTSPLFPREMLREMRDTLNYAKGGAIENQYEGRTAQDIWDSLSELQRQHFIGDHALEIEMLSDKNFDYDTNKFPKEMTSEFVKKAYRSDWKDLDEVVQNRFANHVRKGEYAKGGRVYKDWTGRNSKETWGKENLYPNYYNENSLNLVADVSDYYKELAKDVSEKFAQESKNNMIEVLKTGKITYNDGATLKFAKGGMLKEDDYVWNELGKKLVVNKVTDDEYFLSAFGQIGDSPFSREKVEMYLKNGQWSRKPKMAEGGETKNKWEYTDTDEIEYVVVKDKSGKELKFDGKDVISGVHDLLEKGGKLTEIGKYYSKNDVVSVFVNGKNILDKNTVSGVWIKKDAKPMAGGGFVVVSENDGYWYIMSKPTSKQVAEEFLSTLTIPRGEVGKVVSVEDAKNHKKVIGRKYLKMADGGDVSEMKIGQTTVRKGYNGWVGKTMVDNFKGYDWDITTIKNSRGDLTTTAQGGKSEDKGGYKMFTFMIFQDPSVRLQTSRPARVNEKVVSEQHAEALKVFKEKVGNTPDKEKMADGGAIGFDALAKKVAKNYEGDKVKKQYQDEYGKTYDKKEAEEVGKKVAGKVYGQQQAKKKMAKGGKVAKKSGSPANRSQSKMTLISRKASEIRKANEPWRDAFNRAKAMLYS